MDAWTLSGLAGLGLGTGIVNTLAGGGSLLTLPVLMLLGLPPHTANGTNRVAILVQSGIASFTLFRPQLEPRPVPSWLGLRLLSSGLGALGGALLATWLEAEAFRRVIAVMIIAMALVVALNPTRWLQGRRRAFVANPALIGLVYLGIGVYGGFIQAGVGFFLLTAGVVALGESLQSANTVKNLLVFSFNLPAAAWFASQNHIALEAGAALSCGALLGGYIGARLTLRHGDQIIRWALFLTVTLAAVQMLLEA